MFLDRLIKFFSSLKLTVVLLALGMILVFAGTFGEVELGLFRAQSDFFYSFFVYWTPSGSSLHIPVFPGGYLLGGVLLINLVTAHFTRFKWTRKKIGIWLAHIGLILLLLGQLTTHMFSVESAMHLRDGQTKDYSESYRTAELAVMDTTHPKEDTVVAIPEGVLRHHKVIRNHALPFTVRIKHFYPNSVVAKRSSDSSDPPAATRDVGEGATVKGVPQVTAMNQRDLPSAVVEIDTPQGSLGTWLVSEYINQPQTFTWNHRTYQMVLRPQRHYLPFSIKLVSFTHKIYPGSDIPEAFSSRILLERPSTGESRNIRIYMNHPLRYGGRTFYQASFDKDNHGSVFQVVRNPSWLAPYFSCALVALGLVIQFMTHLVPFVKRRMAK